MPTIPEARATLAAASLLRADAFGLKHTAVLLESAAVRWTDGHEQRLKL